MQAWFADTYYFLALRNPKDEGHAASVAATAELAPRRLVTTTWVLTEVADAFAKPANRKSHPPPRWRQWHILRMMVNYVDQLWDRSLVSPVSDAFSKAISDVERAFELITGTGQQAQGLHDASSHCEDYTATLTNCWNSSLRQKIAKYAYVEPNYYEFERASAAPPADQSPPQSTFVLSEHLRIEERLAAKNSPEIVERAKRAKATFESFKQFLALRQANHEEAGSERLPTFREWLAQREQR